MARIPEVAARLARKAAELSGRTALQQEVATLRGRVAELEARVADDDGAGGEGAAAREFVPTGHFYSAVPSPEHLARHRDLILGGDPLSVPGVDLRLDTQEALLAELAPLAADAPFPDDPDPGGRWRYHYRNEFFAFADGLFLHLLLRHLRPGRVVEVGSGYSSACLLDTADAFLDGSIHFTFVEPYDERLRSLLRSGDDERVRIVNDEVQRVPLEPFRELGSGDLLLIDSTHTVKAGGDVNRLFFEVLPVLAPGVVVHVHDILPGFEYHWAWLEQGRAWAESYLLRAFLQYNSAFEVLLWPSLVARADPEGFAARFPKAAVNTGGSIYLRRRR